MQIKGEYKTEREKNRVSKRNGEIESLSGLSLV